MEVQLLDKVVQISMLVLVVKNLLPIITNMIFKTLKYKTNKKKIIIIFQNSKKNNNILYK